MNPNKHDSIHRSLFIAGVCILMVGLICSKALISIGFGVLMLAALFRMFNHSRYPIAFNQQFIGFGLLFIAPFVSGLWSDSTRDWFEVIANKIMLPVLFWAVYWPPKLSQKEYLGLGLLQAATVLLASFYSIWPLLFQSESISLSYLQAKTLRVWLSNDHLHFSLYVFITLLFMLSASQAIKKVFGKNIYIIHSGIVIWLVVYLHVLGAKTGLIFLYGSFVFYCLTKFLSFKNWPYAIAGLTAVVLVAVIAIRGLPTLQNRVYYTLYDFNQYIHGAYVDGLTDGARVLSWKAGMEIGSQNPLTGVGFGDMHNVFTQWHRTYSAHLQSYNWLQPSNEWLMYLCGSGVIGLVSLTVGLWLIYRHSPIRNELPFILLFFSQFIMMWYEVNLSNQTGIVLFSFFIGWMQIKDKLA